MIREPAVTGQFYSSSPETLEADVRRYMGPAQVGQKTIAVVSPHAGLMYSGHVAGAVFARVALPTTVILIGPNHTGYGPPVSVYPHGTWRLPGEALSVDDRIAARILAQYPTARPDREAHRLEHCLEVQLPFLRHCRAGVQIVPIVLGTSSQTQCQELGSCLAEVIRLAAHEPESVSPPLLLASTDMNHYEPDGLTREKDRHAIEAIECLDAEGLEAAVRHHQSSMCGLAPTMTILYAARALGATRASLIRYATSGEVSGDYDQVVGYAGLTIVS